MLCRAMFMFLRKTPIAQPMHWWADCRCYQIIHGQIINLSYEAENTDQAVDI
jgi:hypothetical protein